MSASEEFEAALDRIEQHLDTVEALIDDPEGPVPDDVPLPDIEGPVDPVQLRRAAALLARSLAVRETLDGLRVRVAGELAASHRRPMAATRAPRRLDISA